jgi:hypothetical protein
MAIRFVAPRCSKLRAACIARDGRDWVGAGAKFACRDRRIGAAHILWNFEEYGCCANSAKHPFTRGISQVPVGLFCRAKHRASLAWLTLLNPRASVLDADQAKARLSLPFVKGLHHLGYKNARIMSAMAALTTH